MHNRDRAPSCPDPRVLWVTYNDNALLPLAPPTRLQRHKPLLTSVRLAKSQGLRNKLMNKPAIWQEKIYLFLNCHLGNLTSLELAHLGMPIDAARVLLLFAPPLCRAYSASLVNPNDRLNLKEQWSKCFVVDLFLFPHHFLNESPAKEKRNPLSCGPHGQPLNCRYWLSSTFVTIDKC